MSCLQNIISGVSLYKKKDSQVSELKFLWCLLYHIISNAGVRHIQCKYIWPILSKIFVLVAICALLLPVSILTPVCFWNECLAKHVRIYNVWQSAFLSLIWTDDLKCHWGSSHQISYSIYEIWLSFGNLCNICSGQIEFWKEPFKAFGSSQHVTFWLQKAFSFFQKLVTRKIVEKAYFSQSLPWAFCLISAITKRQNLMCVAKISSPKIFII